MDRYLKKQILKDLNEKMVFVGGPRQVGKTTLALSLLNTDSRKTCYLNWDIPPDREKILRFELPKGRLLVFDEIHKYRKWRNFLKGCYDRPGREEKILVTGSAKLDMYRRAGDSLQGRYHYLRMHPLSFAELPLPDSKVLLKLFKLGGFPEPYFSGSEEKAKRWSQEYRTRLIRDEVTSLEQTQDLGTMELLFLRLPDVIGSPLSINSLREDLNLSHKTVSRWLDIFENLYAIFRVPPFGPPKVRAVKKEQKLYLFDWTLVTDEGARFENMLACHLLKWIHFEQDTKARSLELRYFRDVHETEVDFVILENGKPIQFVEAKWSDKDINKGLRLLKAKYPKVPSYQVSFQGKRAGVSQSGVEWIGAETFLKGLI